MEKALHRIAEKQESPEVKLTLDILKYAKRFHAIVSFENDTGRLVLAFYYNQNCILKFACKHSFHTKKSYYHITYFKPNRKRKKSEMREGNPALIENEHI